MSILFVLLTFLLILTVMYFRRPQESSEAFAVAPSKALATPIMVQDAGFEVPKDYCFHPGHTWVLDEGHQNARVGIDAFAGNLFGKIDNIELARPQPLGSPRTEALHREARRAQHRPALAGRRCGGLGEPSRPEGAQPHRRRPVQKRLAMRDQGSRTGHQRQEPPARTTSSRRGCRTASRASAPSCSNSVLLWHRMAAYRSRACSSSLTPMCSGNWHRSSS